MGSPSESLNKELEPCASCGRLSDALHNLDGDRLCDKCDAVFWTAQQLAKANVTDETEIIASLAFAAHDRYENLRHEDKRTAFSRDFARRYPSFELTRVVEDVPVIRPRKVGVEVVRYVGSKLPRRVRLRVLSKFADPDEVAQLYRRSIEQERLPVARDSRGTVSWQLEEACLVMEVGPREEIHHTRLQTFDEYPQALRFSFPDSAVVSALCKALLGSPLRPGSKRSDELFAAGLGDFGRPKTKTARTLIPACTAWYVGERDGYGKPEERRRAPRERRPRVAKMLNRHLFYEHRLDDNPYSSADSVWEDAREVGPRFDLALLLLQVDSRL
jgi:hypothetical protein